MEFLHHRRLELPTTRQVELIGNKEFAVAALVPYHKTFVVDITTLSIDPSDKVDLSRKAQIAYLKADKALTKVLSKYADFADVFSLKLAIKLLEHGISDYSIELVDD